MPLRTPSGVGRFQAISGLHDVSMADRKLPGFEPHHVRCISITGIAMG